jgi:hypothetical protein
MCQLSISTWIILTLLRFQNLWRRMCERREIKPDPLGNLGSSVTLVTKYSHFDVSSQIYVLNNYERVELLYLFLWGSTIIQATFGMFIFRQLDSARGCGSREAETLRLQILREVIRTQV